MLISHTHRFAFIHIPKTGGCSVKIALSPHVESVLDYWPNRWLDHVGIHVNYFAPYAVKRFRTHTPAALLARELPADAFARLFKFAFVRNPWDLLVSSYDFLKRSGNHRRSRHARRMRSFAEYVDYELWRGKLFQSRMVTDGRGRVLVNFIGRFESLDRDFAVVCRRIGVEAALPHANRGWHTDYREHYSDRLAARVADRFAEDIERFGYAFADAPAPTALSTTA